MEPDFSVLDVNDVLTPRSPPMLISPFFCAEAIPQIATNNVQMINLFMMLCIIDNYVY